MFKKILLLPLLFGLSAFAAFQYEIVTTQYDNSHGGGSGGNGNNYFYINITNGSGTIYIVDRINNLNTMNGNNVLANEMSDYGYVDMTTGALISGTNNTIITNQSPVNESVYQTGYEVGTFTAGDSIGLWIENKNGVLNASIYIPHSYEGGYGMNGSDKFGTELAKFNYKGSPAIFFGITGQDAQPDISGQPLPGTFASLVLVAGAMGYCRRNRKKKQNN